MRPGVRCVIAVAAVVTPLDEIPRDGAGFAAVTCANEPAVSGACEEDARAGDAGGFTKSNEDASEGAAAREGSNSVEALMPPSERPANMPPLSEVDLLIEFTGELVVRGAGEGERDGDDEVGEDEPVVTLSSFTVRLANSDMIDDKTNGFED